MFRRLNVRSKLLALAMPALIGLCVLAVLGVQSRRLDQTHAEARRDLTVATSSASTMLHELQRERLLVVANIIDSDAVPIPEVVRQRTNTDVAVQAAVGNLAAVNIDDAKSLAEFDLASEVDKLSKSIRSVDAVRKNSGSKSVAKTDAAYESLSASLVQTIGRIELGTSSGDTSAVSRHWLSSAMQAETSAESQATIQIGVSADADASPTASDASANEIVKLSEIASSFYDSYGDFASDADRTALRQEQNSQAFTASEASFEELKTVTGVQAFEPNVATWIHLVIGRLGAMEKVENSNYAVDVAQLQSLASESQNAARMFLAAAAATVLLVTLLALSVSRNITTTLRRLTEAAREISKEQLPALVQGLRSGDPQVGKIRFAEVDTKSNDEFAEVAAALNELARATSDVAAEQHQSLNKGISDIFVNLARRNQTLLDRQIQFIDLLEENEQDADQLEHLFKLDHLATRMRRNAESLLVLAGAEAPRRRSRTVSVSDVIRVAMGEVEDFARVRLAAVDPANVQGAAGVDLAHLLAELMENGTQYSPPDRSVDVVGHRSDDGRYVITVSDQGVGMGADRLAEANRTLQSPPPVGLALSRSLGFVVAGTLAARHGIEVHLSDSGTGGVSAEVSIPMSLISTIEAFTPPGTEQDGSYEESVVSEWTTSTDFVESNTESAFAEASPSAAFTTTTADSGLPPDYDSLPQQAFNADLFGHAGDESVTHSADLYSADEFNSNAFGSDAFSPMIPEAPVHEVPAFEAPAFEAPAYEPAAFEAQAFEPPVFEPPAFEAPVFEAPVFEPPVFEPPVFEPPAFEPPAFEPTAFEATVFEQAPAQSEAAFGQAAQASDVQPVDVPFAAWSAEVVPEAPVPTKLTEMLPEGEQFESGLYSLLGEETEIETTAQESPMVAPLEESGGLPQRLPGATAATFDSIPEAHMGTQTRAPEEVRSVLSRYRSGLVTGRTVASMGREESTNENAGDESQ